MLNVYKEAASLEFPRVKTRGNKSSNKKTIFDIKEEPVESDSKLEKLKAALKETKDEKSLAKEDKDQSMEKLKQVATKEAKKTVDDIY